MRRILLYIALIVLLVLHQDLWFWHDAGLVLGLPVGLTYHVAYCLVAALLLFGLVSLAWPLKSDDGEERIS